MWEVTEKLGDNEECPTAGCTGRRLDSNVCICTYTIGSLLEILVSLLKVTSYVFIITRNRAVGSFNAGDSFPGGDSFPVEVAT